MKALLIYLLIINLVGFFAALIDKRKAEKGKWRISEAALFAICALGGCVGMYASMLLFRHKTKHLRFMIGIPVIFAVHIFIIVKILSVQPWF